MRRVWIGKVGASVLLAVALSASIGAAKRGPMVSAGCYSTANPNFATVPEGCKDLVTGKVWSVNAYGQAGQHINWSQSVSYCNGLVEGGVSDWRAPSLAELRDLNAHGGYGSVSIVSPVDGQYMPPTSEWSTDTRGQRAWNEVIAPPSYSWPKELLALKVSNLDVVCVR